MKLSPPSLLQYPSYRAMQTIDQLRNTLELKAILARCTRRTSDKIAGAIEFLFKIDEMMTQHHDSCTSMASHAKPLSSYSEKDKTLIEQLLFDIDFLYNCEFAGLRNSVGTAAFRLWQMADQDDIGQDKFDDLAFRLSMVSETEPRLKDLKSSLSSVLFRE